MAWLFWACFLGVDGLFQFITDDSCSMVAFSIRLVTG